MKYTERYHNTLLVVANVESSFGRMRSLKLCQNWRLAGKRDDVAIAVRFGDVNGFCSLGTRLVYQVCTNLSSTSGRFLGRPGQCLAGTGAGYLSRCIVRVGKRGD